MGLCVAASSAGGQGVLTGRVLDADGQPVVAATVRASRPDFTLGGASVSDSTGAFRIGGLAPGAYVVRANRVGYRGFELAGVRVADGETRTLSITMIQTARQLATVDVVTSPTAVDPSSTGLNVTFDRSFTELLPSARDASGLLALLPGSRKDQVWGGAPGVSNNYRLDGVSMNHPGLGGNFMSLSVDWLEAVDVKGLGAGAEFGDFQGGLISATTKTGTNRRTTAIRTNFEAARWNGSNLRFDEQGAEQAGRREFGGETAGPIVRDKLFYFAAGQYVDRDVRAAPLASGRIAGVPQVMQDGVDGRGMLKLTWLPAATQRLDALFGATSARVEHDGVNGVDAPDALTRVRQPAAFWNLSWTRALLNGGLDVRLGGFTAQDSREGYGGDDVPGIQVYQFGRQPYFQNAVFNERRRPSGLNATIQWSSEHRLLFAHQLIVGADLGSSRWRDDVTRNGGMTWRPYTMFMSSFDPTAPTTWATRGSDWGGEVHQNASMWNAAFFVQDAIRLTPRVVLTPGLRVSRWSGTQICAACPSGETVGPAGVDPRLGLSWDPTGDGTSAIKLHAGRYHQGISALFFDRAAGANVYSDARWYYYGPAITDPKKTFTVAERDGGVPGFSPQYEEITLSESGRVSRYREPYVDQFMGSFEKSIGPKWKVEFYYTGRRNGDIVGLLDRNAGTNYTAISNVYVDSYFQPGSIRSPAGGPLVLPIVYVANVDLKRMYDACKPICSGVSVIDSATIKLKKWDPDYVLTAISGAKRFYDQATLLVRTVHDRWRGEASFTAARLFGNVGGVTGFGTTGTRFTPGAFARPDEAINFDGDLSDAQQLEGKLWLTARLWRGLSGGVLYTHTYGESYTPTFTFEQRYSYRVGRASAPAEPVELFRRILGQSMLLEKRGSRHYPSRDVVDLHVEWKSPFNTVLSADVFNALATDAVTRVNTNVGDRTSADPTSSFNAVRERVQPRTLRLGLRVETGGR